MSLIRRYPKTRPDSTTDQDYASLNERKQERHRAYKNGDRCKIIVGVRHHLVNDRKGEGHLLLRDEAVAEVQVFDEGDEKQKK